MKNRIYFVSLIKIYNLQSSFHKMAGYSNAPLSKKLGYKADFNILLHKYPINYWQLMEDIDLSTVYEKEENLDLAHLFVTEKDTMYELIFISKRKDKVQWYDMGFLAKKIIKNTH